MKLDILAFGAHPDDVELSCSGTLLVEKRNGKKIGIVDLTQGELGSRGTMETRNQEALEAAKILELDIRENLLLDDGFISNDKDSILKVIQVIRKYKPEVVLCNAIHDRHPDHGKGSNLVEDACFLSGLLKIETLHNNSIQEPWRPKYVFHYIQDRFMEPHFVIDISDVIDVKIQSIKAYKTQFHNIEFEGPETYISKPSFIHHLTNQNGILGKRIGVEYAEGFITNKTIGFNNFDAFIKTTT